MREEMVRSQIASQGIKDEAVLKAMREVPRHLFVPDALVPNAYEDRPLPIGENQTISQPYIVALMTELARAGKGSRVLEVGTGSGYQAAILLRMGVEVYTIEIIPSLARRAKETLDSLYPGAPLHARVGDGYRGWPEAAPFDAVIVTAAPEKVPQPLIDQLKISGRLVIPVGGVSQKLVVITREADGVRREEVAPVRFVPMTGEAQKPAGNAGTDANRPLED
ncbi:MAG TPA: protein-L-isoaspartate(D-aspartate) O-methyltransferase [Candidatus Polarisedimenticolia bacterium]